MAILKSTLWFVLIMLLLMQAVQLSWSATGLALHCPENERRALLDFKQGIIDLSSSRLSSWVGQACCKWQGVQCNNETGHVVKLDLRSPSRYDPSNSLVVGEVSSSLVELKHLNYLDLSCNDFSGINIPNFSGSFQELKYLNLSYSEFGGVVPHHLGNLSNLVSLDLSYQSTLTVDSLQWLSNLFYLEYLRMNSIDLSSSDLSQAIISLPSLLELHWPYCNLDNIVFPSLQNLTSLKVLDFSYNHFTSNNGPKFLNELKNLSNLEILDLSSNWLNGSLPNWLYQFKNLRNLDLSGNHFTSLDELKNRSNLEILDLSSNRLNASLPNWLYQLKNLKNLDLSLNYFTSNGPKFLDELKNLSNLEILHLSSNQFNASLPNWLYQLKNLKSLDLSYNSFHGPIPLTIGKLSALEELSLGSNQLTGPIPLSVGGLSELRVLDLRNNLLTGQIPTSFRRLSNLRQLSLGFNLLNGTIFESLGEFSELTELDLASNSFSGVVSEVHLAKFSKLETLWLSDNKFSLKTIPGWIPPFQLKDIDLSSCDVGQLFPDWLQTQNKLEELVMSNASISGSLPNWFDNLLHASLYILDLSGNQIHGKAPNLNMSYGSYIYLSSNRFEGPLPHFTFGMHALDLSNNSFSGPIQNDIGDILSSLSFLDLSSNHISGIIPRSFCKIHSKSIDISENHLSGSLPNCWSSNDIETIDLSSNNLSGTIPSSIGQLSGLRTLRLSNNSFHKELPSALQHCKYLSVLDLGENLLSGIIPAWIGANMLDLRILRLRSNNFRGSIPPKLCYLINLHIMDLGHNNLSGVIPQCIGNLSSMFFNHSSKLEYVPFISFRNGRSSGYQNKLSVLFRGREDEYMKTLQFVINMDLSSNNLVGEIPKDLTRLTGLIGLNLSDNYIIGSIPENIGQMNSLESLDFSINHIHGTIPEGITSLRLNHLNVSYNNLSGSIPLGTQLQSFEASAFESNLELCGLPLDKKCFEDEPSQEPAYFDADDDDFSWLYFYIGMAPGFVVGFWGVCGVMLLKKTWRHAYFRYLDYIKDKLLLVMAQYLQKLKGNRV